MQKWEYKTLDFRRGWPRGLNSEWREGSEWVGKEELDLEKLGRAGWELVAVVPTSNFVGPFAAGFTSGLSYIFKRPLESV